MSTVFLGCIQPKTLYTTVGVIYSFLASISFAYCVWGIYISQSFPPFGFGCLIVFGLHAFFWSLDQLNPQQKYKRRFVCLYKWLTLVFTFLIFSAFALVIFAFSCDNGCGRNNKELFIFLAYFLYCGQSAARYQHFISHGFFGFILSRN